MTIAQRLYLLITAAVIGLLLLAGINLYQMGKVYEAANFSNVNVVPSLVVLDKASQEFGRLRVRVYRHVLNTDQAKMADIEAKIKEAQSNLEKLFTSYDKDGCAGATCIADDKDKALLLADRAAYDAYIPGVMQILEASRKLENAKAMDLLGKYGSYAEKLNSDISDHIQYNVEVGTKSAADAVSAKSSATWISIILGGVILFVIIAMGIVHCPRSCSRVVSGCRCCDQDCSRRFVCNDKRTGRRRSSQAFACDGNHARQLAQDRGRN